MVPGNGIIEIEQAGKNIRIGLGSGRYKFSYSSEQFNKELQQPEPGRNNLFQQRQKQGYRPQINRRVRILQEHLPDLMNSPWLSRIMGLK